MAPHHTQSTTLLVLLLALGGLGSVTGGAGKRKSEVVSPQGDARQGAPPRTAGEQPEGVPGACASGSYTIRSSAAVTGGLAAGGLCRVANPDATGNRCFAAQCVGTDTLLTGSCSVGSGTVLSNSPLCLDHGTPVTCDLSTGPASAWTCTADTSTTTGVEALALCCGEPPSQVTQVLNFDDRVSTRSLLNDYQGFKFGGAKVMLYAAADGLGLRCNIGPPPNGFVRGVASLPNAVSNLMGKAAFFCQQGERQQGAGFVVTQLSATPVYTRDNVTFTGYGADGVATGSKTKELNYTGGGPNIVTLEELGRIYSLSWVGQKKGAVSTCVDVSGDPTTASLQVVVDDIVVKRYAAPVIHVNCPSLPGSSATTESHARQQEGAAVV